MRPGEQARTAKRDEAAGGVPPASALALGLTHLAVLLLRLAALLALAAPVAGLAWWLLG